MNNESEAARKVVTIQIEFSAEELQRVDAAATVLKLTRDGFLRHATAEYIRQQNVSTMRKTAPPLSAGYAAALAERRPPTIRDIIDSYALWLNQPSPRRIPLSEEQSDELVAFALCAVRPVEDVSRGYINTEQLLTPEGFHEARFWCEQRSAQERPVWARHDDAESQREFSGVLAALHAFRALKQRTPRQNSAWQ